MAKEAKRLRDERKKPQMSLKEKRAKKHDKKLFKLEHRVDEQHPLE